MRVFDLLKLNTHDARSNKKLYVITIILLEGEI